jgi:hypothetical protein
MLDLRLAGARPEATLQRDGCRPMTLEADDCRRISTMLCSCLTFPRWFARSRGWSARLYRAGRERQLLKMDR